MGHRLRSRPMANDLASLRNMSDAELVEQHDRAAVNASIGVTYYLDELARRDTTRSEARIEAMTKKVGELTEKVKSLTVVITVLTAINTVAAVVGAYVAIRA